MNNRSKRVICSELGVVVFKGQDRAICGVIIGLWIMKGAQSLEKGTKGYRIVW